MEKCQGAGGGEKTPPPDCQAREKVSILFKEDSMEKKLTEIRLTAEHQTVLAQFGKSGSQRLSSDEIQRLTNIEPIKISAILADLMAHDLLHHTESDEPGGYWLYHLTEEGGRLVSEQRAP
jgi:DNA-binding MarR family transcriptional regulator